MLISIVNVVVGNCAGTFSGLLSQLSWLDVADLVPELQVYLHTNNKTQFSGNTLSQYQSLPSNHKLLRGGMLSRNLLLNLFDTFPNSTKEFPDEFIYVENYPVEFRSLLIDYPQKRLKYHGRGGDYKQYSDLMALSETRRILNKQFKKLTLRQDFSQEIQDELLILGEKKTLGIMIRYSNHYNVGNLKSPNVMKNAIKAIRKHIDDYDQLLVITMVQPFADELLRYFGKSMCVMPSRNRNSGDTDWKGGDDAIPMDNSEYLEEYKQAFIDVHLASQSDFLILGSSNMSLGALVMNPELPFQHFLDRHGR